MNDIATRVYNHNWKHDPIVRYISDTDFYKSLMCQNVYNHYPNVEVEFRLINRNKSIPLANLIDEEELRWQLDYVRSLRLTRGESTYLRGNTFYGVRHMFNPEFMEFMENLQLPPYELSRNGDQYELTFKGKWEEVMHWEIPALSIINELKSRAVMKSMKKFELDVLYARAKTRLWDKIKRLGKLDNLKIADFGTRRRHSFLWQEWCIQAMQEGLGDKFLGTSNCIHAMNHDLEAIGTNAHELPMVVAGTARSDKELHHAPYDVLRNWEQDYDNNLQIILPDTYGTKAFFRDAPKWVAKWKGVRIDSGDPREIADFVIDWWQRRGEDPKQKMIIFSDGLDIDEIESLYHQYHNQCLLGFGWGTLLTNDFRGLTENDALAPFSLVCKVKSANGNPAVKLSDNPGKAMGPPEEIERYKQVFNPGNQTERTVIV